MYKGAVQVIQLTLLGEHYLGPMKQQPSLLLPYCHLSNKLIKANKSLHSYAHSSLLETLQLQRSPCVCGYYSPVHPKCFLLFKNNSHSVHKQLGTFINRRTREMFLNFSFVVRKMHVDRHSPHTQGNSDQGSPSNRLGVWL